jgi:hypothetical protein
VPSLVAWLDASSEDQRRMREIVNLFSERESRDELGIGQVRDALSDTLFPGTSTLLTRARYMILIPWCFVAAAKAGGTTAKIASRVDENERLLISALRADGDEDGLLGRIAGPALKNLPSSLYWVSLRQFGILTSPNLDARDAIDRGTPQPSVDAEGDEGDLGAWSPTLPDLPTGFPANTGGGFALSAGWLQERILEGTEGSLLSHLAQHRPDTGSPAPWFDSSATLAVGDSATALTHARLFSFALHGAALLYNLLLAERYELAKFNAIIAPVDEYRSRLADWHEERQLLGQQLADWDRTDFWRVVSAQNPRIAGASRRFVDEWLNQVISPESDVAASAASREFIAKREASHKRGQARLTNDKLLASWLGASGAGALTFRWSQVRGVLADLHDGLERTDA